MKPTLRPITGATLSKPYMYEDSFGDTWTSTWADDDRIYALSCDTTGWYEGCTRLGSNLAINLINGDISAYDKLDGKTINPMKTHPYYYGMWAELKYDDDGKIRMWKGNGLSFIDGVLYLTVSRHGAMEPATRYVQDAIHASIVKSTDYGMTWTPEEKQNYFKPMFPGTAFSTPFFVEYGKDGKVPDGKGHWVLPPHGGDRYVYAVSNDGFWNNGNYMKLGRVLRTKLADLQAKDWEFYKGPSGGEVAGLQNANWITDPHGAEPILGEDGKISQAGVQYIWQLDRYVMIQAYYPSPYKSNFNTGYTCWDFYEAPTPWGPWTKFHQEAFNGNGGFYNPDILSQSITYDPDSRSCSMTVLTAGDWKTCNNPDTIYRMHAIELTLHTK